MENKNNSTNNFQMNKILKTTSIIIFALIILFVARELNNDSKREIINPKIEERTWMIKSVDTMKYSRDLSQERLKDESFDSEINAQVKAIKSLNANYIAIGTPYDEKFVPILSRWVSAARKNNLKVWFRGNFSGWEGWFGKRKGSISREEHTELLRNFINNNPDLFRDGDIFSPCPECENGGPGDPRIAADVELYRKFLIDERNAALDEFGKLGKRISVLDSMNFDVARLVMDKETAKAMGNIVAIDHYVKSPQKLAEDVDYLSDKTGAKIFLGEFGAPIPDIHGLYTEEAQADWIEDALSHISKKQSVIGVNYWVAVGGSTALFKADLEPKKASVVIKNYFSLKDLN